MDKVSYIDDYVYSSGYKGDKFVISNYNVDNVTFHYLVRSLAASTR